MKKIVIFLLVLAGLVWLAGEVKNFVEFYRTTSGAVSPSAPGNTAESAITAVPSIQEKWQAGQPFTIHEQELTAVLQQIKQPTSSKTAAQQPIVEPLSTRITPEAIQLNVKIDMKALTSAVQSSELRQLLEPVQQWLGRLHQTTVPISIRLHPRVYNERIVYTENVQIQVANVPLSLEGQEQYLDQLIQQLIQQGQLPARARKIELQDGQMLVIP